MQKPHKFSLSEAAKFIECSKGTLSKAIKNKELSAVRIGNSYEITIGELQRWNYNRPKRKVSRNTEKDQLSAHLETLQNSALQVEVDMLRDRLAEKDSLIGELKAERETELEKAEQRETHWREQTQRMTALLTDERKKATEARTSGFSLFGLRISRNK